MTDFVKFPSINQYRNTIKWVREGCEYHSAKAPIVPYVGTVKLHGTNAAVVRSGGQVWFQSRNRVLTPGDDNAGFAKHMDNLPSEIAALFDAAGRDCAIFGEWCGEGIQRGIAISALPKMFVVFAMQAGDEWLSIEILPSFPSAGIYKITDFPTFAVDVDFDKPEIAQSKLQEITVAVELSCPVGGQLDAAGIGEGVVWRPADPAMQDDRYWFKVKGEKHSASKVRTLAAVDVEAVERKNDLVDSLVTAPRLEQGLEYLREQGLEIDIVNIGTFIRWVFGDIAKEDSDTITASGFTVKELGSPVAIYAKRFFMAKINEG